MLRWSKVRLVKLVHSAIREQRKLFCGWQRSSSSWRCPCCSRRVSEILGGSVGWKAGIRRHLAGRRWGWLPCQSPAKVTQRLQPQKGHKQLICSWWRVTNWHWAVLRLGLIIYTPQSCELSYRRAFLTDCKREKLKISAVTPQSRNSCTTHAADNRLRPKTLELKMFIRHFCVDLNLKAKVFKKLLQTWKALVTVSNNKNYLHRKKGIWKCFWFYFLFFCT